MILKKYLYNFLLFSWSVVLFLSTASASYAALTQPIPRTNDSAAVYDEWLAANAAADKTAYEQLEYDCQAEFAVIKHQEESARRVRFVCGPEILL